MEVGGDASVLNLAHSRQVLEGKRYKGTVKDFLIPAQKRYNLDS